MPTYYYRCECATLNAPNQRSITLYFKSDQPENSLTNEFITRRLQLCAERGESDLGIPKDVICANFAHLTRQPIPNSALDLRDYNVVIILPVRNGNSEIYGFTMSRDVKSDTLEHLDASLQNKLEYVASKWASHKKLRIATMRSFLRKAEDEFLAEYCVARNNDISSKADCVLTLMSNRDIVTYRDVAIRLIDDNGNTQAVYSATLPDGIDTDDNLRQHLGIMVEALHRGTVLAKNKTVKADAAMSALINANCGAYRNMLRDPNLQSINVRTIDANKTLDIPTSAKLGSIFT